MKKRLMAAGLASAMAFSLAACGGSSDTAATTAAAGDAAETTAAGAETEAAAQKETGAQTSSDSADGKYELALVTDLGTIDDKSFNQGAWEGLKKYADENGITYKYYQPQEGTTDSYLETIGLAIEGGAKLVVCPGYLFEEPVYLAQTQYPDTKFILLDGEPHDADYNYETKENVMPVLYQEDQAGFLAGYAAVKDGNTKLGFMGGLAVPAVIKFGYGYVQGAEAAAKEDGVNVDIMYNYTGQFAATPEAQAMAASWYQGGTQVIFGCGGAVGNSVMAAAEEKNAKVIGVDVDQSSESDTVITSAMKELSNSVYEGIKEFYAGAFPGGKTTTFDASTDGIGLPMATSKFEKFTQEDYDAEFKKLADGEITLVSYQDEGGNPVNDLTDLTNVKVTFVE